ncbi:hypothetical protein GMSM_36510 [Geomonas sp. Red276]
MKNRPPVSDPSGTSTDRRPPAKAPSFPTDQWYALMIQQLREYAVVLLDGEGTILSWNGGAEAIYGYRPEEAVGRPLSLLIPPEEGRDKADRELTRAAQAGSLELVGWRPRKDGSRFWAELTLTALKDESGAPAGFSLVARDGTRRHGVEETLLKSRGMFERLFETSPDAIVVVDGKGLIRKVNQQTEVLFGYQREELIGELVERLVPPRFHDRHVKDRAGYFREARPRKMGIGLDLYGMTRDGREVPVDIMLTPIEMPEGTWAFAVIRDMTRQRKSEAKIGELNGELRRQIEKLEASNRELEAFSYSVSHDLRAPLRHVIGFVDLLVTRGNESLDDKSRHYLEVITEAAKKMGDLIDDLLAFSRMGRSEMMKSRVDMGHLVRDIVGELAGQARERSFTWAVGPLPSVTGDSAMLRQVVYNLLANAVKFTRDRPAPRIEVGALETPEEYQFFVRDNGVGFDAAYVGKLFGLFQRLHRNEEFEGTGVGLAIVQRIIARHGGKVWAEGNLEEGATFWFTLPRRDPNQ